MDGVPLQHLLLLLNLTEAGRCVSMSEHLVMMIMWFPFNLPINRCFAEPSHKCSSAEHRAKMKNNQQNTAPFACVCFHVLFAVMTFRFFIFHSVRKSSKTGEFMTRVKRYVRQDQWPWTRNQNYLWVCVPQTWDIQNLGSCRSQHRSLRGLTWVFIFALLQIYEILLW